MKIQKIAVMAMTLSLAVVPVKAAQADEILPFFQATCIPEMEYFSFRTFMIENITSRPVPELTRMMAKDHDMFNSVAIRASPPSCTFPPLEDPVHHEQQMLVARMVDYVPGHGGCGFASYKVSIELNGEGVYNFSESPCSLSGTHSIEINGSEMRVCNYQGPENKTTCEIKQLRN